MSPVVFLKTLFFILFALCGTVYAAGCEDYRILLLPPHPEILEGRTITLDQALNPFNESCSWITLFKEWERKGILGTLTLVRSSDDHQIPGVYFFSNTDGFNIPADRYIAQYSVHCFNNTIQFFPILRFSPLAPLTSQGMFPPVTDIPQSLSFEQPTSTSPSPATSPLIIRRENPSTALVPRENASKKQRHAKSAKHALVASHTKKISPIDSDTPAHSLEAWCSTL